MKMKVLLIREIYFWKLYLNIKDYEFVIMFLFIVVENDISEVYLFLNKMVKVKWF